MTKTDRKLKKSPKLIESGARRPWPRAEEFLRELDAL
jgi:hypothetical protein